MYVRRFGAAEESDGNAPPTENTNTSPIQASAVQNVNENPPMSVETSKMSTPIAKLFEEPSELSVEAINKHWQDKVAFLLALGLPESKNIQQIVEISKQLQDMSTFGQQLISQVGGISSTIASKLTADMTPNANEGSAEKGKEKKSIPPPKLIWNSYKKEYQFTRDETAAESEALRRTLDVSMRKTLCSNHCLINSIRPANYALSSDTLPPVVTAEKIGAPPGADPPHFPTHHPNKQPSIPPKRLKDIPLEQMGAITDTLASHVNRIFYECVRMFKTKCRDIEISENIAISESELRKTKVASEAAGARRKQQHQIYKERFTKSGEVPPGGQGGDLDLIELQQPSGHVVNETREKGGKGRGRGRGGSVNLSYVRGRDSNQGRGRGKN
eukprot:scaffold103438_cov83-Cyclotella_meneghiniana.AAC.1